MILAIYAEDNMNKAQLPCLALEKLGDKKIIFT